MTFSTQALANAVGTLIATAVAGTAGYWWGAGQAQEDVVVVQESPEPEPEPEQVLQSPELDPEPQQVLQSPDPATQEQVADTPDLILRRLAMLVPTDAIAEVGISAGLLHKEALEDARDQLWQGLGPIPQLTFHELCNGHERRAFDVAAETPPGTHVLLSNASDRYDLIEEETFSLRIRPETCAAILTVSASYEETAFAVGDEYVRPQQNVTCSLTSVSRTRCFVEPAAY